MQFNRLTFTIPLFYLNDSIRPRGQSMGDDLAEESKTVEQVLDSTLESVDKAEQVALDIAREAGFADEDLDGIGMSVRECMGNAVVQGIGFNALMNVHFSHSVRRTR